MQTEYCSSDILKELRRKNGLSQSQITKKFGIPLDTYVKWEQGVRTPPQYVVKMIATILDMELSGSPRG